MPDECRPVEIEVDGQAEVIRVHGGMEPSQQDAAALGALVSAARRKVGAEHPHLGVIQELMSAWMSVRRQLPANDSRIGRDRNIAAAKDRMSAALAAVRAALEARPMQPGPYGVYGEGSQIAAEQAGSTFENSTEWGVRWPGSIADKVCESEESARQVVHLYRDGTLLSRPVTVIRGPWKEVDGDG